jgi:hypothetical protein
MEEIKKFSIDAKTCTLKYNSQNGNSTMLGDDTKYIIPIYQRPYSWTNEQIKKFFSDIFLGYWGTDGKVIKEPMFIGTMQLTEKNSEKNEQQIIDGQQRLTTFLILFKILKLRYPDCKELKRIKLNWIETKVNNGLQQKDLNELLTYEFYSEFYAKQNTYVDNANIIKNVFEELISEGQKEEEGETENDFNIDDFVEYLLSNIYFVVIETYASLSKTLQIFNSINTAGLDLNSGDIFKLRMFEYLCGSDKDLDEYTKNGYFEKISRLYETIGIKNKELGGVVIDIYGVLEIYKYIIITKFDLPKNLYFFGVDRFYEELFDTLSNSNRHEHFQNVKSKGVTLSLQELEQVIESRFEWEKIEKVGETAADNCAWHFIWWSRYSRYHILIHLFSYQYYKSEDYVNNLFVFQRKLSKLFIIYSIRFQKLKSEIYYTAMYEVLDCMLNKSFEELLNLLDNKIGKLENHKGEYYDLNWFLENNLTENAKRKNIICRLSALLDEDYLTTDKDKIKEIVHKIFQIPVDIEHIQSYHDRNGEKRQVVWDEWGDELNSLGNLMVLEESINRGIGNNFYMEKVTLPNGYLKSEFAIVKKQKKDYSLMWTLEDCLHRKAKESKKITDYLFS